MANKAIWQPRESRKIINHDDDKRTREKQAGRLFFPDMIGSRMRYCAFKRTRSSAKSAADVILGRAFNNLRQKCAQIKDDRAAE